MSVVSVQPKDFILALFIRDDGERFLLGDNGYDFMDSQLHFAANTIENDEVEKQGADGTMLAGQVRRASVQTFDGYVGDATTPKEEIEQMRRAFIAFFLKGHHYRVIYVDCARNAWQRKGGYLVDAPEVKELFQVHPEYHVGLNFEDVNYYSYDENAEGDEITANLVQVAISSAVEGGLVWDEDGAVSEDATVVYDGDKATASGQTVTLSDAVEAPLSDFKLKGETSQQTYTGSNPVHGNFNNVIEGGLTWEYDKSTGEFYVHGTAASTYSAPTYILFDTPLPAGQYTFFITEQISGARPGIGLRKADGSSRAANPIASGSLSCTVNSSVEKAAYDIYLTGMTPDSTINVRFKCMLVAGTSTTAYEPYVGGVPAPNPDYPQAVQVVTGENVVKISDGQGNEQSYTVDLGSIELCKIGDYQDYIYKSGGKWYVHKETGKVNLSDCTWYNVVQSGILKGTTSITNIKYTSSNQQIGDAVAEKYIIHKGSGMSAPPLAGYFAIDTAMVSVNTGDSSISPTGYMFYALATPTDTEITDAALIAQLEAILSQGKTYAGTNNITTVIAAGNEQGELEVGYYTRYEFEITAGGYVWEEGGSGGPTTVMNESIDNVYPIWTITGPITNPVLENTTTGEQIEYVGTIGEGQTLVIDMGAQTALLDGLNVVANIVGEFLSLAPGSNTLIYSVDSGDKASEIGWSEIVG